MTDRPKPAAAERRDHGKDPRKADDADALRQYKNRDQLQPQGRDGPKPDHPFTVEEAERRKP